MGRVSQAFKLRFLHAMKFNEKKAAAAIHGKIAWEAEHLPATLTPISAEMLDKGVWYIHGRDK